MNKLYFILPLLAMLLFAGSTTAQVARLVHYEGVLHDSTGGKFTGVVDLKINLYNRPAGTTPFWSEDYHNVQVKEGQYSVLLGSVTPLKLSFHEYFLEARAEGFEVERIRRMIVGSGYNFRMRFLFAAYTIVWLALFLYMVSIARRQIRLKAELQALAKVAKQKELV